MHQDNYRTKNMFPTNKVSNACSTFENDDKGLVRKHMKLYKERLFMLNIETIHKFGKQMHAQLLRMMIRDLCTTTWSHIQGKILYVKHRLFRNSANKRSIRIKSSMLKHPWFFFFWTWKGIAQVNSLTRCWLQLEFNWYYFK